MKIRPAKIRVPGDSQTRASKTTPPDENQTTGHKLDHYFTKS